MSFLKNKAAQHPDDRELVVLYKQSHDMELLGELYQRYMDLVFGVCLRYLQDNESAKDAVMSIFEELVTKLQKHQVGNFKSWLYTLSKNYCLMQLRSSRRLQMNEVDEERMQLTDNVHLNGEFEKEETLVELQNCLESLSDEQKMTVSLFYLENKSYKEIAEMTGLEWNRVRSLIQNGRRNIKICMDSKKNLSNHEP